MKRKKDPSLKIISCSHSGTRPYPNAASKRYYLEKVVDCALTAATCIGTVTIFLFFLTLA